MITTYEKMRKGDKIIKEYVILTYIRLPYSYKFSRVYKISHELAHRP